MEIEQLLEKIARGSLDAIEDLGNVKELSQVEKAKLVKFFHEFEFERSNWHTSNLIDLLNDLDFFDEILIGKISDLLTQKRNYLVKLSIFDYLFRCADILEDELVQKLNNVISSNDRLIVKNQALLMLIAFSNSNENLESYKTRLIEQMKRTFDYRAHIRLYNSIMNYSDKYDCLEKNYLTKITAISDRNMEARSVKEKLKEFKLAMGLDD